MKVEFRTTAAVLDCGEAHVQRPYAVENRADGLVVTVLNGTPLPLALRADGSLAGAGTVEVAGRLVTGVNDAGAAFAPVSVRCAVGVLSRQQP